MLKRPTILVSIAILAILIRVPFFAWPLISDEGGYAYTTHWWFQGYTLYGPDLWFDRPQGIFLAYKLGSLVLGDATWAIRLWGALWSAGAAVFVHLVARRLADDRSALFAGLVFAAFSALPQIEGFTANAEVFALLPATAAAWALLSRRYWLVGLLASVAFLLKPSGGSIVLLVVVWLLYQRTSWRAWAETILAALPLPLACFIQGTATVGLSTYVQAVTGYRTGLTAESGLGNVISGWRATWLAWLPLALVSGISIRTQQKQVTVFLSAWLLSALAGMAMGGNWHWHYFIQIVPPLAVCAGIGLAHSRPIVITAFATVALIGIVPLAVQSPKTGAWSLYHRPGYQIAQDAAAYMRSHTKDTDSIYVAFAEGDIYHLARRRSAAPNLFHLELLYLPGAYDRAVDAIETQTPLYVLALDMPMTSVDPTGRFWQALEDGYEVETTFQGVPLYVRHSMPPS